MTLEYSVDRATFDELIEEARRRIIPRNRNWTMHGPVDPGITVLELYAALLEQRSFVADQITAPLGRALLALLGESIKDARPARCVLAFDPDTATTAPRGLWMRPDRARADKTFRVEDTIATAPFDRFEIHASEGVRTELRNGVELLPAHGRAASCSITLHFTQALADGAWTGVLLDLESKVAPQWGPDAADVPPPASIRLGWRGPTTSGWFAAADVRDGTGGMRRSGIVRFRVPTGWRRFANGGFEYEMVIDTAAATFTSPVRLVGLAANATFASHRHWRFQQVKANALRPVSGQELQLALDAGYPLVDRARLLLREIDGQLQIWKPTDELGRHGPGDRVFVVDRALGRIRFGDGFHGRTPYPIGDDASLAFEVGGGDAGNIGGRVRWSGSWNGQGLVAENPLPAIGGSERETFEQARDRIAGERTRPTRSVTKLDHETIAKRTPGVAIARAYAHIGFDPTCPTRHSPGATTVYVVPDIANRTDEHVRDGSAVRAPRADAGALTAVRAQLAATRLVAHTIYVEPVSYQRVRLELTVRSDPADAAQVRSNVASAMRVYLDPLLGGPDQQGWGFGSPLMPSDLLRRAQRALDEAGDGGDVAQVRIAFDDEKFGDACTNRDIEDYQLVELVDVRVQFERGLV